MATDEGVSQATLTSPSPRRGFAATGEGIPRWLYGLFFLSGISGLMYEVVWVRMLTRILGSTVYATSTVLAAFMAGLALGSLVIGRQIDRVRRPLRWYAALELGIGLSALLSLALPDRLLPLYRALYGLASGSRGWLTAGQVLVALAVLLLPTALMGATLPALSAFGSRSRAAFGRYVGTLYALNTLGAVVGVLASGFVLIGELGETTTVVIGVALNVAVAIVALALGRPAGEGAAVASPVGEAAEATIFEATYSPAVRRVVIACFAVAGFASLANEVAWSRMLLLYQGTSIYAFSSMLAVILAGMAAGSILGGKLIDRWRDPLLLLARLQLAIGVAGALALLLFGRLPLTGMFRAPVVLLGPLGFLWGLAFPVVARCYARTRAAAGRSIAELYAWNTIGCIAGSLAGGFLLIPLLGASHSVALLAGISLLLGLALLAAHPRGLGAPARLPEWALVAAGVLMLSVGGDPYFRLIQRRAAAATAPSRMVLHSHVEDASGTTTTFGTVPPRRDQKYLWVNGIGMTKLVTVTKLMSHLPLWLADEPRDFLAICFGMGTSVRSASRHDGLQVRFVELVPAVVDSFGYFHEDGPAILHRPAVHPIVDDGRNYLLMHPKKFDVINIDPAPPLFDAGTVNLYCREFYQLCHDHIQPGGVVCSWIPPYKTNEVKMIMRSFLDVFDHVEVWSGGRSHDGLMMIGSLRPLRDVEAKIRRGFEDRRVIDDLTEWDREFDRPEAVIANHVAGREELVRFLADSPMITDDHPYLEFPLWRFRLHGLDTQPSLTGARLRAALAGRAPEPAIARPPDR